MKDCHFFIGPTRRETHWSFHHLRGALNCLPRSSFIAAHEFKVPVNDHLRGIDAPEAKPRRVGTLPLAVFVRRVGILPSDVVPVVPMLIQDDPTRPTPI